MESDDEFLQSLSSEDEEELQFFAKRKRNENYLGN